MAPEKPIINSDGPQRLKKELQTCFLDLKARQLINRFLDSSPECRLPHRLSSNKKKVSLWDLTQFAPMAAIQTLLPFAKKENLKEITGTEALLAFVTAHSQAVWEIIKNGEGQEKFLIHPKTKDEEVLLLFIHSANPAQVESLGEGKATAEVNFGQQKISLRQLFVPSQLSLRNGDFILTHCGWVIEKIDKALAKEIGEVQKGVQLERKSLFQIYSCLPSQIDFQTVFGGFFSGQHR